MSLLNDASLVLVPSGYKEDVLYCQKPTDGSGDLTFSRASTATRVNSEGLIEKVRTNLLLQSETFDNAAWIKEGCSVTANSTTDPFGTSNADVVVENAVASTQHRLLQIRTISNATQHSTSVYVKRIVGTRNFAIINIVSGARVYFDLTTGTVGTELLGKGSIQNIGNGWYRCTATGVSTGTSASVYLALTNAVTAGSETYSGDGVSSLAFYGAQLETGDIATDYIPTTSAAVSVGMTANVPRLDYTNSSCPSLLLEPQRTNLNPYSEQFNNAGWEKVAATITANQAVSPDGYTNADAWFETSDNNWHRLYDNGISVTAGTVYTCSLFVKPNGRDWVAIEFFAGGGGFNGNRVWFNISNGTIGTTQTGITAKIEDYGNGWYRIQATQTALSSTTGYILYLLANADGAVTYTGDPTKGAFVYGGMTEVGSYATSYIPTLSTSVTRVQDSCYKTGISDLIGQTEGTLFIDINISHIIDNEAIGTINSGGYANNTTFQRIGNTIQFVRNSATQSGASVETKIIAIGRHKMAIAYKSGDTAFYLDGLQVSTTQTQTFTNGTLSVLRLGADAIGALPISDTYNQVLLFKTRLSNTELAQLTTL